MAIVVGGRLGRWLARRSLPSEQLTVAARIKDATTVGERLRILRLHSGLFQKDIVRALRLPQDKLSHVETGKSLPTSDELKLLADFFAVTPAELDPVAVAS